MDYWNTLKTDQLAHQKDPKNFQAPPMRTFDGKGKQYKLDASGPDEDPSTLTSYFSPNTPKARSKSKTKAEAEPADMKDLETRIKAAKNAVLFLAFIPGTPSITNFAAETQKANKNLFVRGSSPLPTPPAPTALRPQSTSRPTDQGHRKASPKPKKAPVQQDPRVIAADALNGADAPTGWLPELLKAGSPSPTTKSLSSIPLPMTA